jgi:hypothetical protein
MVIWCHCRPQKVKWSFGEVDGYRWDNQASSFVSLPLLGEASRFVMRGCVLAGGEFGAEGGEVASASAPSSAASALRSKLAMFLSDSVGVELT